MIDDEILAAAGRSTPLSVTASSVQGQNSGSLTTGTVTSAQGSGNHSTNTQVFNGSGSYTFSWTKIAESGGSQSPNSATAQNPVFSATVANGTLSVCDWRVTATDTTNGRTAQTQITCTLQWTHNPPPPLTVDAQDTGGSDSGPTVCGNVVSAGVPVIISNGSGNYTISWAKVADVSGGSQSLFTASNVLNARFQGTACQTQEQDIPSVADWRITVQDQSTGQVAQDTIRCTLQWSNTNA